MAKGIATTYELKGEHAARSFRHAAATTLAETGMSITALFHASRWKSYKTAEGHKEHSNVKKDNRMSRLDDVNAVVPNNAVVPCKKARLDKRTDGHGNGKALPTSYVVHGNYTYVSFDGFKGTNVSFLNKLSSEPAEETSNENKRVKSDE